MYDLIQMIKYSRYDLLAEFYLVLQSTSALRQNVGYLFNRRFNSPKVPPYSNYVS